MAQFEVVVGNIGTVATGDNPITVGAKFHLYKRLSVEGVGRGARESVTMLKDGEIMPKYDYSPQGVSDGDQD